MKSIRPFLLYSIAGLLIWLGLNGGIAWPVVVTGFIISTVIYFISDRDFLQDIRLTPRAGIATLQWLTVFATELIRSNIDVIRRVLSPRLPINPGIVEVKTRLTSRLGRLVLANSITLTPGTLTVDVKDDRLYIHWIDVTAMDVDAASRTIVARFEKHLEVMFG